MYGRVLTHRFEDRDTTAFIKVIWFNWSNIIFIEVEV